MMTATSVLPNNSATTTSTNLIATETTVLKKCVKCGKMLPLSEFKKSKKTADGHICTCKECVAKKREENAQKRAEISPRPIAYIPQPGKKATLSLADFTDDNLCAELRRRGFTGELTFVKKITV